MLTLASDAATQLAASPAVDATAVIVGLLGGLSIFLYGMTQMTDALKSVAGDGMRAILAKLTRNRFSGAITGAVVTALVQSSSVTTVLLVGFISAGLMSLQQSVGVIMGANIGSTVTAQLIAFRVTDYALGLVTIGFALLFFSKKNVLKQIGATIMGLGLIFLGMSVMSDATTPLRTYQPFIDAMSRISRPVIAVLASAVFTAIIQSSAATTGIVIVLAGQGFISLEAGIALALGSNIGTCATAILAAAGKPRPAVQAAAVHILFNVVGVLIWIPLLSQLAAVVTQVSPQHPELDGAARLAAETPRQIANAHTLFNVANAFIFIWFTGPIAALVRKIIPDRPEPRPVREQPRFLDPIYLETPALALDRLRLEIAHLGRIAEDVVAALTPTDENGAPFDTPRIKARSADANTIDKAIIDYARRIAAQSLTPRESEKLQRRLEAANHFHSISDIVSINIVALARRWADKGLRTSPETDALFQRLHTILMRAIEDANVAVRERDLDAARRVQAAKTDINATADALFKRLALRLGSTEPNRVELYQLESELVELFKRIYYFAKRAARAAFPEKQEPEDDQPNAPPDTDAPV